MAEREHPYFPPIPVSRPPDYIPLTPVAAEPVQPQPMADSAREPITVELPTPTGEAAPPPEAHEQERLTLAGRLGQDPRIRTTAKGTLVAQFPLGVKADPDLDKTTWHTVVAFRQRAEQIRDTLKKGDAVEVIGYRHEREVPRRDGTTRTVQEVWATVIKRR